MRCFFYVEHLHVGGFVLNDMCCVYRIMFTYDVYIMMYMFTDVVRFLRPLDLGHLDRHHLLHLQVSHHALPAEVFGRHPKKRRRGRGVAIENR